MMELKNSNCEETQIVTKPKMKHKTSNCDESAKTQIVMKLKNSNVDEIQKLTIVTKFKNSNRDKAQKLKWWQNSNCDKTQMVRKRKKNKQLKMLQLKLWQNTRTQIMTKPQKLKLWPNSNCDKTWEHFDTLTTDEMFSGQRFAILAMLFYLWHLAYIGITSVWKCQRNRSSLSVALGLHRNRLDSETGWTGELWSNCLVLLLDY